MQTDALLLASRAELASPFTTACSRRVLSSVAYAIKPSKTHSASATCLRAQPIRLCTIFTRVVTKASSQRRFHLLGVESPGSNLLSVYRPSDTMTKPEIGLSIRRNDLTVTWIAGRYLFGFHLELPELWRALHTRGSILFSTTRTSPKIGSMDY